MARRVRIDVGSIDYQDADVSILALTKEAARKDPDKRKLYAEKLKTQGKAVPQDFLRRITEGRPFISWDGEGVTDPNGEHRYILFGSSEGDKVTGYSLGTVECFTLLLQRERQVPHAIHIFFAGSYDVNMMLKDVPIERLEVLKAEGFVKWNGYRIEYRKGKYFRLNWRDISVTVWDVFSFFGCSAVKAFRQYIPDRENDIAAVEGDKEKRANFINVSMADIERYWILENELYVALCEKLRENLLAAGIRLGRWHGPGAVATVVLKSKGYKRTELDERVNRAAQYAYAGGRFEQFKVGHYDGPLYQYDIRSAYPFIISTLPGLSGEWHHEGGYPSSIRDFSLYRVSFDATVSSRFDPTLPLPLHWRAKNGAVFYPPTIGDGWYWGVEVKRLLKHFRSYARITESWIYDDPGDRPFNWVPAMYERRAQWKRDGNPAQLALKLALNSMYGKMAQQVGWRLNRDGSIKIPTFHQLEYAGYVTAATRALLFDAMMQKPEAVIACETDAVFTLSKLKLPVSEKLGSWDLTEYSGITYVQSGVYFVRTKDGWKNKSRGFEPKSMSHDKILEYLGKIRNASDAYDKDCVFQTSVTRFKTMGSSLGSPHWRRWITESRSIRAGAPGGKREHFQNDCDSCGKGTLAECLHDMVPALSLPTIDYSCGSTPYPLKWKGDPPSEYIEDEDVHHWEVFDSEYLDASIPN